MVRLRIRDLRLEVAAMKHTPAVPLLVIFPVAFLVVGLSLALRAGED